MRFHTSSLKKKSEGFILPYVAIASLLIGTGMLATLTRSWIDYKGTIRQSQSRIAREAAESGLTQLVEALNRNHAQLLIVDHTQWANAPLTSSRCSNSSTGVPAITGKIGEDGFYKLESYSFKGTPFYGGKGNLRMRGEVRKDGETMAAAIVTQTVEIKPESCTTSNGPGFPGLLGEEITLGNNDVLGRLSGNVFCTQCNSENDIGAKKNSIIGGDIFIGAVDMPAVPTPPLDMLDLYDKPFSYNSKDCKGKKKKKSSSCSVTDNKGDIVIVGGSSKSSELLNGSCKTDLVGITHCVVEKLNIKNNELKVNTEKGPVRIYFTGTGEIFKSTGNGGITHVPNDAPSTNLGLFGNPQDPTDAIKDQNFTLRGAAGANNIWAYFPDGHMGIAGGASDNTECETLEDGSLGECTGGDIYGAVWGKSWGQTKGASSGNGVQIVVPSNMGEQLLNAFGSDYAVGVREYVAKGVSKWSSQIVDSARSSP